MVHPDGEEYWFELTKVGYTILRIDTPVVVEEIKGKYRQTIIKDNGCCGEKELI